MKKNKVKELAFIGVMAALVFVTTNFLSIKIPVGAGMTQIHMGNVMCILSGLLFGPVAGGLASAGACLYYLAGNTEFFWSTYLSLPPEGFNGIPVALLAANNPIAVVFSGLFMSMLNICGTQLKSLTAYNEYIADIIIAVIVYLSAFSMFIKQLLNGRKKKGGNK